MNYEWFPEEKQLSTFSVGMREEMKILFNIIVETSEKNKHPKW